MRTRPRRFLLGVVGSFLVLASAILWSARPGDPALFPAGPDGTDILVVSNGYHAGLIIPVPLLASAGGTGLAALGPLATRFRHYDWVEIGWGDADFYRAPDIGSLQWGLALTALKGGGGGSVLHVVGITGKPEAFFEPTALTRVILSPEGLRRLTARLDTTFARGRDGQPEDLGPGLYGPSLFYRANGRFNLLNVCNHWVADLLNTAGVPTTPLLAMLPAGLLADLKWRSGLTSMKAE